MFSLWRWLGLSKKKVTPVIPLPNKMVLTGYIINKISPSIKGRYAEDIANALNRILPLYQMDRPTIFHEFWANILEESWEMGRMVENLNYSTEALIKMFGRHRISVADARTYGRWDGAQPHKANQPEIANRIYGGEWGRINLGNVTLTDGWDMRGSGPMQLTGRGNITRFTKYYNNRFGTNYSVYQMVELLRNDLDMGIHSACWVFAIAKELIDEAVNDQMQTIIKKINGGLTNLEKRLTYYAAVKKWVI